MTTLVLTNKQTLALRSALRSAERTWEAALIMRRENLRLGSSSLLGKPCRRKVMVTEAENVMAGIAEMLVMLDEETA